MGCSCQDNRALSLSDCCIAQSEPGRWVSIREIRDKKVSECCLGFGEINWAGVGSLFIEAPLRAEVICDIFTRTPNLVEADIVLEDRLVDLSGIQSQIPLTLILRLGDSFERLNLRAPELILMHLILRGNSFNPKDLNVVTSDLAHLSLDFKEIDLRQMQLERKLKCIGFSIRTDVPVGLWLLSIFDTDKLKILEIDGNVGDATLAQFKEIMPHCKIDVKNQKGVWEQYHLKGRMEAEPL